MKRLNTSSWAFPLMIFLAGILYWILVCQPLYEAGKEKQASIRLHQNLLIKQSKITTHQTEIEKEYKSLTKDLLSHGSDEQEIARLQNDVTRLAQKTAVKVEKTKSRPMQSNPNYKLMLIELDCQGTILQLTDFIYRMQYSPQVLKVETLRLNPESSSTLRASLLISKISIQD